MSEILAEVYRNKTVESVHYGSVVVTDRDGNILYYAGDPEMVTYTRSSLKPFQFTAVYESGATKRFGHSLRQMAIMIGSHNGSEEHQRVVRENLTLIGLDENYLQCGTQVPIEIRRKGELPVAGQTFSTLAHNCSGKHSGQLALALQLGDDVNDYINPESKTQKLVRQTVSEICGVAPESMSLGTDGCSLPNYAFPIRYLARGFASIVTRHSDSPSRREAFDAIVAAITKHPEMVSGEGRSDLAVTRAGAGDLICKIGGEAVQGIGVISKGVGIAIKMADGQARGLSPVICEVLRQLDVFGDTEVKALAEFARPQLYNDRKLLIGEVVPVVKLKRG